MRILAALACLALTACGLQPMYAGGSGAAAAQGIAAVDIPAIQGRGGWLVKNALEARLGIANTTGRQTTPQYRLDVRLDDSLEALGVLNDDTISRERRILRARYHAGIDVVSSEYATIAAEQKALENLALEVADRMATQIALTLRARRAGQQ